MPTSLPCVKTSPPTTRVRLVSRPLVTAVPRAREVARTRPTGGRRRSSTAAGRPPADRGRGGSAPICGRSRSRSAAAGIAIIALVIALPGGGASWPGSVAQVQAEITTACENPNVAAEPSQLNFACAKSTQQILWVFALLTSGNNPGFVDSTTGRKGLEPIQPAQGGDIAWSLNLHQPYSPANPVDSLQVAARAINNIISGATLTSSSGTPDVEPGLESTAANCQRYTGSALLVTRSGFPARCAQPVSTPSGQAALVSDVFQQWMGGTPVADGGPGRSSVRERRQPGQPAGSGDPREPAELRNVIESISSRIGRNRRTVTAEGGKRNRAFRQEAMVAAGNGARHRDHRRRDYRLQLRPRGGRDDDLADQRATAPASPRAGGAAWFRHERQGHRRRQRRQRHQRRAAPVGHRQRREVLPADRRDSQSGPDGGAHLGQHQPERRRPRAVVRGLRQPHPGTGRAGGRPAKLGQRREELPVSAARVGRRPGRHEPGVARRHLGHGGRPDARPLASGRRRLPAPAGRLGPVRASRRGRDRLLRRGARHHRRGLRTRPDGQRPLLRRHAGGGRRGRLRRQRAPRHGLARRHGDGAHGVFGCDRRRRGRAVRHPFAFGAGRAVEGHRETRPTAGQAVVPGVAEQPPTAVSPGVAPTHGAAHGERRPEPPRRGVDGERRSDQQRSRRRRARPSRSQHRQR